MKWRNFTYLGTEYNLSHLHQDTWIFTLPEKEARQVLEYKFNVIYTAHCFTRDPLPGENIDNDLWYEWPVNNGIEKRLFCFDRFDNSVKLPDIVRSLANRVCWHTHHGSFFTIELFDKCNNKVEYEVYFDIVRTTRKGWLNLIIKSAYVRTNEYITTQPKKQKIRFEIIAYNRLNKKPIKSLPKK